MRYRLAHSREIKKNRWNNVCPECGRRGKFSPYIDTVTNKPIAPKECGRCCREKSCAYHMTPSEWFKEHPTEKREWLPREQYVELMKQRRREARVASYRDTISYPLRPMGSSPSCTPTRPAASPPCQGDSADSPIAERNAAEEVIKNELSPFKGDERRNGETERRGYEIEEYSKRMNDLCLKSRSDRNNLARWLATRFPAGQVAEVLARYRTGSTRDGRIVYWQIDEQGQVRAGKVMAYDLDGHRVKRSSPPLIPPGGEGRGRDAGTPPPWGRSGGGQPVCWVHSMKIDGVKFDEMLAPQCLFGLHLLNDNVNCYPLRTTCSLTGPPSHRALCSPRLARLGIQPTLQGPRYAPLKRDSAESTAYKTNQKELSPFKGDERRNEETERRGYEISSRKSTSKSSLALQAATPPLVRLVESEKTALIMSLIKPDTVWLATGGKANFKESMLWPLLGHEVAVYPDADALCDWELRIHQLNRELGHRLYIPTGYYNLMDHEKPRTEGWDLADAILREE